MRLCFATNNAHKIEEVGALLQGKTEILSLEDIGCSIDLPETRPTIEGNARQKAEYVWLHYHVPCFADDTGLEVDQLGGAPGVISARYAGLQRNSDDNIRLLWNNLEGKQDLAAQFRTVIVLITGEGDWVFEGIVRGKIIREKRGTGGFGYDPVFLPDGHQKTLAEMTLQEKNRISHRAIAVGRLVQFLKTQV